MHRTLLSLGFAFTFIANLSAQSNGFEVIKNMELMDQIYQHLEMYYVDEPQTGKLSKVGIDAMLKEDYLNAEKMATLIKSFELPVVGLRPIDEVISTVGGIALDEINADFELIKLRNFFCIGEMLDWDAPTGGYLIQGAVSTGAKAAHSIILNLDRCAVN